MSLNVEKRETGPGIAQSDVERCFWRKFPDDQPLERCSEHRWKQRIRSALRNQRDRAWLKTAQPIVENENRKERVRRSGELQRDGPAR